jgi:hypothetical protein
VKDNRERAGGNGGETDIRVGSGEGQRWAGGLGAGKGTEKVSGAGSGTECERGGLDSSRGAGRLG